MVAGDADAGQRSEAMLNGRGRACAGRRRGGGAPSEPRADYVAPRGIGAAGASVFRPPRRVRPSTQRRGEILVAASSAAAAPAPGAGAVGRGLPGPVTVDVEGIVGGDGGGGAAGVEFPNGRNQAFSGQPAPPPGELPLVPPEPEPRNNNDDVVFEGGAETLHFVHPR